MQHEQHEFTGSWEAYNERKIKNGLDPDCFSPEELWEFNYLIDQILTARPHLDEITVILAVREGMRRTMAPRPRQHFVSLVMENIRIREDRWNELTKSLGNRNPGQSSKTGYSMRVD